MQTISQSSGNRPATEISNISETPSSSSPSIGHMENHTLQQVVTGEIVISVKERAKTLEPSLTHFISLRQAAAAIAFNQGTAALTREEHNNTPSLRETNALNKHFSLQLPLTTPPAVALSVREMTKHFASIFSNTSLSKMAAQADHTYKSTTRDLHDRKTTIEHQLLVHISIREQYKGIWSPEEEAAHNAQLEKSNAALAEVTAEFRKISEQEADRILDTKMAMSKNPKESNAIFEKAMTTFEEETKENTRDLVARLDSLNAELEQLFIVITATGHFPLAPSSTRTASNTPQSAKEGTAGASAPSGKISSQQTTGTANAAATATKDKKRTQAIEQTVEAAAQQFENTKVSKRELEEKKRETELQAQFAADRQAATRG